MAGTYTTNAFEIDQMLNDAWAAVYERNVTSHKKLVDDFDAKYGKYIYRRKGGAFKPNPLCGGDVKATCKEASFSAAGLDQWSTQDFAILDDSAYDWLARMYNQIERGASWPEPTLHAKGSYLFKS